MSEKLTPPLKWHGGKHYLAPEIIDLMPPRCQNPNAPKPDDTGWLHYVEPFFGGGSVLLANDPTGISEVVNDIHEDLTNFWTVLANAKCFEHMSRVLQSTPFSKPEWLAAMEGLDADHREESFEANGGYSVARACWFFIACRQSHSGRMKDFAALTRNRTRGKMNEQASAWMGAVDGLAEVHQRLRRVVVLNDDALSVIRQQDGPRTLFYLDPPYLHSTRASKKVYAHEMDTASHDDLLRLLATIEGRFLLSGYGNDLYDAWATTRGWKKHTFDLPNNSAGGKEKRRMTECVWTNY